MTISIQQEIKKQIDDHISVVTVIRDNSEIQEKIQSLTEILINVFHHNGRVWFCGNGGSAADAQHLASELSGKFYLDRPALPAEALHVNSSFITAVGNDYGFDHIFSRALEAQANGGDALILLSTSGASSNILKALKRQKKCG